MLHTHRGLLGLMALTSKHLSFRTYSSYVHFLIPAKAAYLRAQALLMGALGVPRATIIVGAAKTMRQNDTLQQVMRRLVFCRVSLNLVTQIIPPSNPLLSLRDA